MELKTSYISYSQITTYLDESGQQTIHSNLQILQTTERSLSATWMKSSGYPQTFKTEVKNSLIF